MRHLTTLAVVGSALLFTACGGGTSPVKAIKNQNPTGQLGGQSWSMAKATVTNDGTNLHVYLFSDSSVPDCTTSPPSSSTAGYLMWTEPAQVGARELQLSFSNLSDPNNQTVTFVTPPSNNNIAVDGALNVVSLDASSATIGINASAGTGYSVNGTFTATLCH